MKYTVEQRAECRWVYTFEEKNQKDESLVVELSKYVTDMDDEKSMPFLWKKHGWIKEVKLAYWCIDTCVRDSEGYAWIRYNPEIKDGKINFDWKLEATEENRQKILEEIYKRFMAATGKSATELKMDRIREYAEKHHKEIYAEVPKGWKKLLGVYSPVGTVVITNGKGLLSGEREEGLLLE